MTREGKCIGKPSRCRGGTCSCCGVCGSHRWGANGECLTCCPPKVKVKLRGPVEVSIRKPRGKALIEANRWYEERGLTPPWDD